MDEPLAQLRNYSPDAFRDFLRNYLHRGLPAFVSFPPNERPPLAFARLASRDRDVRALVLLVLPDLIAELSTAYGDDVIERAMLLHGYCRVARATASVIALCDELDRRERNIEFCLGAVAAQLPSDAMLDFLLRKGVRPAALPICLRALLRLDRQRAARLLTQVQRAAVSEAFLRSALTALNTDELLDAIKAFYDVRPTLHHDILKLIERVTAVTVIRGRESDFSLHVRDSSMRVQTADAESRNAWFRAAERTSSAGIASFTSKSRAPE